MKKNLQNKLKLATLLLLLCIFAGLGCVSGVSAEKTNYTDFFKKDSVINIEIFMEDDDLSDMRAYPENEEYHTADVTIDGVSLTDVGLRTKGNMTLRSVASSDSERYSYRLKFDKYVKGQTLLGLDELCLNNQYSDPSYMREYLHYEMLRSLGMTVPKTVFCTVSINGEYTGFYLAVEGLDDTFLESAFGENYKDGNFYKMDEGSTLAYREDETYSYADLKVGDDADLTEFKSFVKRLNAVPDGEKGGLESFLDVSSALKYIASNTVLCNYDSYNGNMHHNFYLYENADGIFSVIPWDFNMSFGGFDGANSNVGIDTPVTSGSIDELPLIGKLLAVPEYKEKYYGYIKQLMNELEDFESRVNALKKTIASYVKADSTAFYGYEAFEANTTLTQNDAAAKSDTANNNTRPGGRGGFGGNVSIVQCAADRLANLKAQFGGTADTKTENQKGFGGRGENRGNRDESAITPPEGQNGTPPQGDMQPPNGEPPQGMQPPENGDHPENGGRPGGFPPQGGMNGRPGARPEDDASTDMQPPEPPENSDGQPEGAPPQIPNAETDASGENAQMPKDDGFRGGRDDKKQAQNTAIRFHVNGHIIRFNTDPVLSDTGSTLVGYRSIMEELGAAVSWDETTKTVTAEKDGTTVTLTIGSDTAYVNGKAQTLTQPPEIQNDSTMIPIRFMAEALGMKVGWTESSRLITITSK